MFNRNSRVQTLYSRRNVSLPENVSFTGWPMIYFPPDSFLINWLETDRRIHRPVAMIRPSNNNPSFVLFVRSRITDYSGLSAKNQPISGSRCLFSRTTCHCDRNSVLAEKPRKPDAFPGLSNECVVSKSTLVPLQSNHENA